MPVTILISLLVIVAVFSFLVWLCLYLELGYFPRWWRKYLIASIVLFAAGCLWLIISACQSWEIAKVQEFPIHTMTSNGRVSQYSFCNNKLIDISEKFNALFPADEKVTVTELESRYLGISWSTVPQYKVGELVYVPSSK